MTSSRLQLCKQLQAYARWHKIHRVFSIQLDFDGKLSIGVGRGEGMSYVMRDDIGLLVLRALGWCKRRNEPVHRRSTMMSKKIEQKAERGNVIGVDEPTVAAKPKKIANVSSRKKKAPPQSKSDRVLTLLRQSGGVSLDELMRATKWQAHSVRGFLSGAVKKRKGLMVMSATDGEGTRHYRIEAGQGA